MNRDTLKTQIDALADSIQTVKDKGPSIQETLTKHASRAQAKALSGSLTGKDLTIASFKKLAKYAVNNPGEILLGGVAIAMFDIEDIS